MTSKVLKQFDLCLQTVENIFPKTTIKSTKWKKEGRYKKKKNRR